jgi:fibronectin type 3 domain-containing protein
MGITTANYLLEAFIDGDTYSALADKRRFSTIDNQLYAMATIIGDGRVDGWEIQNLTFPDVRVTKGNGFIDGYYVSTFNDQEFTLEANSTFNFYAQRRVGMTGTVGPRSNVESITYTDVAVPASPTGFTVLTSTDDPYFTITTTWDANSEADFDHYELERSTSATTNFALIATVSATSYDDTVNEDTTYYYRLYAVDQSGFRSSVATGNATTLLSPALPSNPIDVLMRASEGAINVLWKRPVATAFANIDGWEVSWVRLESDGSEISATSQVVSVDRLDFVYRIDNVINGETYKVTLITVDNKGRKSEGFVRNVTPQLSAAPKDPENIVVNEIESGDSILLDVSWAEGADEYDPSIPYRYNIYVTVDGFQESLAITVPIGDDDQQIEMYTFDLVTYNRIPQNALVTLRLTSLTDNGVESAGNYVRFRTTKFEAPLPVSNLEAEFDEDRGKIVVTWSNPSNISYINIQVFDDDVDDEYNEAEIFNGRIGLIDFYEFDGASNHIYRAVVTTYDADGTVSDANSVTLSTVATVSTPDLPRSIFVKTRDRQISFNWIPPANDIAVRYYRIYKKTGPITTEDEDWALLDTLPYTIQHFDDYGLTNDQVYSYYITSVDLYNTESLHLPDGVLNLNFVEGTPKASGILTEPDNLQLSWSGTDILVSWESLLEEFDAFSLYRSTGNLHLWELVTTLGPDIRTYLDEDVPLVDGTVFYYSIDKAINDADIIVQVSSIAPESSIFLGQLELDDTTFGDLDISDRRDLLDFADPLAEYTDVYVLSHKHRGIGKFDPERVDLNPELIITDWETVDGRIFTTAATDISGTSYIVKINERFPSVLFSIDATTRRLIFTEPIVSVNNAGDVIGTVPAIEMRFMLDK